MGTCPVHDVAQAPDPGCGWRGSPVNGQKMPPGRRSWLQARQTPWTRRSCWVCFLSKQDSRPDPGILMQKLKYNDESCAAKTE